MKTYLCGTTNAGNIAVMLSLPLPLGGEGRGEGADVDCNGALIKYVLVVKDGEWVKYANFPNHVPNVQICAENAYAAAEAFAGRKFDGGLGEAKGWELQRAAERARNDGHLAAFQEKFAAERAALVAEAEALTIGQLRAKLTPKQFGLLFRSARDGYSANACGGDQFIRHACLTKLKAAMRDKELRRKKFGHGWQPTRPKFGCNHPAKCRNAFTCRLREKLNEIKAAAAAKKAATLAKRRAPMQRLAVHIARFYRPPGLADQSREPRYGYGTASESACAGRGKFYTVAHARPGVTWEKDGLYFHPIRNANQRKIGPRIRRELFKRVDLEALHPVGLFAARLPDAPEYVACYDASADKKSWVVAGFAYKGHLVPESVVRGTVTLPEIAAATNDELRRILIDRYGTEKYLADTGATPVHADDWGTLYDLGAYRVVRMVNSTVEADGTAREYFRAVPNTCATARAAIAWTYNLTEAEYFAALTAEEAAVFMS